MGLSGRKNKQKIPNDPRNLSWADGIVFSLVLDDCCVLSVTAATDAARFGSNYLSKFGWDSSKGLGAGGDGRTSHIKVSQKLDMMGIGGAHQNDPNGIAWKQNRDFESLLKRLNEANGDKGEGEEEEESGAVVDGFVREEGKKKKEKKKEKKEKRKREEDGEGKCKKPRKNEESAEEKPVRVVPRHRSHRARHIAAKSLACKSAAAISEILGIAPSAPPEEEAPTTRGSGGGEAAEKITTATKSLEEYFREKMGGGRVA